MAGNPPFISVDPPDFFNQYGADVFSNDSKALSKKGTSDVVRGEVQGESMRDGSAWSVMADDPQDFSRRSPLADSEWIAVWMCAGKDESDIVSDERKGPDGLTARPSDQAGNLMGGADYEGPPRKICHQG